MRRGFAGTWFMAGLAMVGALVGGGREAQAGSGGITVGVGVKKGGDPFYTDTLTVSLDAGASLPQSILANPISLDLTFTGLTGLVSTSVDTTSIAYQFPPFPTSAWNYTINTNQGGTAHLQESNFLGNIGPYLVETELFQLVITTPDTSTQTGLSPGDSVNYSYTITGSPTVTGSVIVTQSVPEPSSIILALIGGTMLPLCVIRSRRRRAAGRVA